MALRRPVSDFYVSGRLVPPLFNGVRSRSASFPVLAFAGLPCARRGWDGASFLRSAQPGAWPQSPFLIAPYLRNFGGYTVPDFLGERFNLPGIRPLAVLAVILCLPGSCAHRAWARRIATRIFAIDLGTGVALAVAMLLSCSLAAGMRSASLTQILQCAVRFPPPWWQPCSCSGKAARFRSRARRRGASGARFALEFETFAADDKLNRFALLFSVATGLAAMPHLLRSPDHAID